MIRNTMNRGDTVLDRRRSLLVVVDSEERCVSSLESGEEKFVCGLGLGLDVRMGVAKDAR